MDEPRREFLDDLLSTHTPSGFEAAGQRRWIEYVEGFADDVRTDAYGNAVAVVEGEGDGPTVALAGHCDEIGFMVRDVEADGTVRVSPIGGSDRTVSKGQHVRVHAADGPVQGVIGQTPVHLRERDEESIDDIGEQYVDVGAADAEEAETLVERGDPITFEQTVSELANDRVAARGMDNRVGIWAAAEGVRRAAESGVEATVCAVSTVQEEVGLQGAKMVGFDLAPDAVVAVDVTHASDTPGAPLAHRNGVELGGGPVVVRGSSNHPRVVDAVRAAAASAGVDVQLQASGSGTRTDADAFFTARGGIPSLYLGVPNRYMHTPAEVVDLGDLEATASLLGEFLTAAHEADFSVDL
jgi:endoglucanase